MKNKLREIRKEQQVAVKDLARETGVTPSMIYQVERDEKAPSLELAQNIARILGKSTDEVFLPNKQTEKNN